VGHPFFARGMDVGRRSKYAECTSSAVCPHGRQLAFQFIFMKGQVVTITETHIGVELFSKAQFSIPNRNEIEQWPGPRGYFASRPLSDVPHAAKGWSLRLHCLDEYTANALLALVSALLSAMAF
jgi:hypothetical protein